jgi:hypothetical protein
MFDLFQVLACKQVAASRQEMSVTLPVRQTPLSYRQFPWPLKHPDQAIRTGDPIDVDWDVRSSLDYLRCRTPRITGVIYHCAYPVRGEKIFAFPCGRSLFT